ncbi:MAG: hypothetical protein AB7O26_10900 [Planctomycetaceae bacterium]
MSETYQSHGIRFEYPELWELSEQRGDNETTITVESPDTSFWSLSIFYGRTTPEEVLETAVSALQEAYEEVDVYPSKARIGEHQGGARDVEFVCYELINSAFLRAFETDDFTALVYYQGTDHELVDSKPVLEAITASLRYEPEEDEF